MRNPTPTGDWKTQLGTTPRETPAPPSQESQDTPREPEGLSLRSMLYRSLERWCNVYGLPFPPEQAATHADMMAREFASVAPERAEGERERLKAIEDCARVVEDFEPSPALEPLFWKEVIAAEVRALSSGSRGQSRPSCLTEQDADDADDLAESCRREWLADSEEYRFAKRLAAKIRAALRAPLPSPESAPEREEVEDG